MKKPLLLIKVGGKVLDDESARNKLLHELASSGKDFILVHGGGNLATRLAEKLNVPQVMREGRRVTDAATLDIALMCYAGLLNKKLVAFLQSLGKNCLGLSGADANTVPAQKREHAEIDYGWVGDPLPEKVNSGFLKSLIEAGIAPVFCALTHDEKGQMLNTNADTMARCLAIALSNEYAVDLVYLFEKQGVLRDIDDARSVLVRVNCADIARLKEEKVIQGGMIPKLDNASKAIKAGVARVLIGSSANLQQILDGNKEAATYVYP